MCWLLDFDVEQRCLSGIPMFFDSSVCVFVSDIVSLSLSYSSKNIFRMSRCSRILGLETIFSDQMKGREICLGFMRSQD